MKFTVEQAKNKMPKAKYQINVYDSQHREHFGADERPNAYEVYKKFLSEKDSKGYILRKSLRIEIGERCFDESSGYWYIKNIENISEANVRSYPEYKAEKYAPQSKYHKEVLDKRIAFYLSIRLYSDVDSDIVAYFKEHPQEDKSAIVKAALRQYLGTKMEQKN